MDVSLLWQVGDQHRGYLLELLLTKLRYASGEGNTESHSEDSTGTNSGKSDISHGLQIVGMSATMPNVAAVADWLQVSKSFFFQFFMHSKLTYWKCSMCQFPLITYLQIFSDVSKQKNMMNEISCWQVTPKDVLN